MSIATLQKRTLFSLFHPQLVLLMKYDTCHQAMLPGKLLSSMGVRLINASGILSAPQREVRKTLKPSRRRGLERAIFLWEPSGKMPKLGLARAVAAFHLPNSSKWARKLRFRWAIVCSCLSSDCRYLVSQHQPRGLRPYVV